MKNLFLLLVFAFFASGLSKAAPLQALQTKALGDSVAVIISDAKLHASQHGSIASALKSMPGVNYVAYCSNHAVYILYINTKSYRSKEAFISTLIQDTGISDLYLKNSDNPMQLLGNCQMDAATSESLKLKYGK